MEPKVIGGIKYVCSISLRQDELLAPIILELLKEIPDAISHAGESSLQILGKLREGQAHVEALTSADPSKIDLKAIQENILETQRSSVAVAMDMMRVQAWIYSKGYAKRIMALLMVPMGEPFNEAVVKELEEFFALHADRETANEVINFFFQRSGVFGVGMQAFLPKAATR